MLRPTSPPMPTSLLALAINSCLEAISPSSALQRLGVAVPHEV